jgi:hypothetical protein
MATARKSVPRIIIPYGAFPEFHEIATAQVLIREENSSDIEFLIPNRTRGAKTPDIAWNGGLWEIKCPFGKKPRTIQDMLKRALRQSKCVIFDNRFSKISDKNVIKELKRQADMTRSLKRLIFIDTEENVINVK